MTDETQKIKEDLDCLGVSIEKFKNDIEDFKTDFQNWFWRPK